MRAEAPGEAMELIRKTSVPDANHNCWAYKVGGEYRFSDDGEPGGSAGRPILAAIEGQELDRVAVVVARYFGGIKLGVGGLVRAYGGAASECLRQAQKLEVKPLYQLRVEIPFPDVSSVYNLLPAFNVRKTGETYVESGAILELELEQQNWDLFRNNLTDVTKGKMRVIDIRDSE